MKAVKPLREASDDLAQLITLILQYEPWDRSLVKNALQCYKSWFDYAIHCEEVKIEILFPYLPSSTVF